MAEETEFETKMRTIFSPAQLAKPPTVAHLHGLIGAMMDAAKALHRRVAELERASGVLTNPKPVKRSIQRLNVLAHGDDGRVKDVEKLESEPEEIDVFERLRVVEQRMAEVEAHGIAFRGVWKASERYQPGACVSHQGSMWVCRVESLGVRPGAASPGVDDDGNLGCWVLAVKKGRDGKDAAK